MSGAFPVKCTVKCTVNGAAQELQGHPMERLLDSLRDTGLTGTKEGCGEGECGACTILMDGEPVNSCLVPLAQAEGAELCTVEGLPARAGRKVSEDRAALHPVQACFVSEGGAQCGICTPGMLVAATALLERNAEPTDAEVREALAGNLCRCTGYMKIVNSVMAAAREMRAGGNRAAPPEAGR
ncbi:MAG: (2Fe-2S)-binding protein [Bdellovibrionales bacterium]|nr:(2Fe-2S)-binding protein [Bdellovibrionales bacterium]